MKREAMFYFQNTNTSEKTEDVIFNLYGKEISRFIENRKMDYFQAVISEQEMNFTSMKEILDFGKVINEINSKFNSTAELLEAAGEGDFELIGLTSFDELMIEFYAQRSLNSNN